VSKVENIEFSDHAGIAQDLKNLKIKLILHECQIAFIDTFKVNSMKIKFVPKSRSRCMRNLYMLRDLRCRTMLYNL